MEALNGERWRTLLMCLDFGFALAVVQVRAGLQN